MNFSDLGLGPEVLRAIQEVGYGTPTPIQERAIPYVLMGRDVLGCAQTGTGKTASFTWPMIEILTATRARARMPRSLILSPTRELAAQSAASFERYGKYHKLDLALLIGGISLEEQEKKLDRGVQVLIATPGRLLDLFDRGKVLLADVKILVIDEADRMLDMGFIPDVERIVKLLPKIRQTLFFSATMTPEVRKIADTFLMNPKEIAVDPPASAAETVAQSLLRLTGGPKEKRAALRGLLDDANVGSALVFCNRKKDVDIVQRSFEKHKFSSAALHGDMAQSHRMETLDRFKAGEVRVLVCSDVAARGLDIPAVSHVFNFDVPNNPEDYIHRIGRTGRAGRSGRAILMALPEESKALEAILHLVKVAIPEMTLENVPGWDESCLQDPARDRRKGRGRSNRSDGRSPRQSRPPREDKNGRRKTQPEDPKSKTEEEIAEVPVQSFGDHVPAFMLKVTA